VSVSVSSAVGGEGAGKVVEETSSGSGVSGVGGASEPSPVPSRPNKAIVELSEYGRTASEKMMEFLSNVTMEVMETYQGAEGTPLKFEARPYLTSRHPILVLSLSTAIVSRHLHAFILNVPAP
jgi:hypothetical protein